MRKFKFNNPQKVEFSKEEKKIWKLIIWVWEELEKINKPIKQNNEIIDFIDIEKINKKDYIFLIWTPIEKAPFESILMWTLNNWEMDLNLIQFMLNKWWINTIKSDFNKIWKILEWNNEKEKEFLKNWNYFISSLPPMWENMFYKVLDKQWIKHINSNAFHDISDLFYTYQVLEKINANQPKTVFLQTNDIFKYWDKKWELELFLNKIIRDNNIKIWDLDYVFLRSGRASFKNLDKRNIDNNNNFLIIKNLFRYIGFITMNKIQNIPLLKMIWLKQKNIEVSKELLEQEVIKEIKSNWYDSIIDTLSKENINIEKYEKLVNDLKNESDLNSWWLQWLDKFKFNNTSDIINFLNKNLLHIIWARLLTNSWIAIREFIDIEKFEDSEKIKFQVPLSKDYRCIINNWELMNVTTWTPYNALWKDFNNEILKKLKLDENDILEIKKVVKNFSNETWLNSYTLDVMKWKDWKLYFYEMNRLEHSHMSHIKTRIILAYENSCRLANKKINKDDLNNFIEIFKDKTNFEKIFYWNFFDILNKLNLENNWKYNNLIQIHKDSMDNDYHDFINFDVIWNKYYS